MTILGEVTYGGVHLIEPGGETVAWVAATISTADVYDASAPDWPGPRQPSNWPFPPRHNLRLIEPGRLFWPRDAQQHAVYHGFCADDDLPALRLQAYAGGGYVALPLVLDDGAGGVIATNLYLLPPRPLSQCPGRATGERDLYLLTLVDARFFWTERAADVTGAALATWTALFAAIAAGLGIALTVDAIPAAYLTPPAELTAHYESLPLLLDAACQNIGHRFVRGLDGVCQTQGAATAKAAQDVQATKWPKLAGGLFAVADLLPEPPAAALLAFPARRDGVEDGTYYPVATAIASGHVGTRVFHDANRAVYVAGVLSNGAALAALAAQATADFAARVRGAALDVKFAGIVPYEPEGMSASVLWTLREGEVSTRVQRGDWFERVSPVLEGIAGGTIVADSLSLTAAATVTIAADQNNYAITDNVVQRWTPTGADRTITGIVPPAAGALLVVYNTSATLNLTLANQSASSSAANRILTLDGGPYVVPPGGFAMLWYDATAARWRVTSCCAGGTTYQASAQTVAADQNNYAIQNATVQRWTPTGADRTITGIVPPAGGTWLYVYNTSATYNLTLKNQDASSSAVNRFITPSGGDVLVTPGSFTFLWYDSTSLRWRITLCCNGLPTLPTATSTALTGDQPALALTPGSTVYPIAPSAPWLLQGIVPPSPAVPQTFTLVNTGTLGNTLTIKNLDPAATATNRIVTPTGGDLVLDSGQSLQLLYVPALSLWYAIGGVPTVSGSGLPSGAVDWVQSSDGAGGFQASALFTADPATGEVVIEDGTAAIDLHGVNGAVHIADGSGGVVEIFNGVDAMSISGGSIAIADTCDFVLGIGTGTKFGTAANQALAFHGATPVVQRASANQAATVTTVAGTAATNSAPYGFTTAAQANAVVSLANELKTLADELRAALVEKGLIKGSA